MDNSMRCFRGLAAAILLRAVQDSKAISCGATETRNANKGELNEFFRSEWCQELCTLCNVDQNTIREKYSFKETSNEKIV